MIRRVGLVGLSSFLSLSCILLLIAAAPKREAAPKKDVGDAEPRVRPPLVITEIMYDPQSAESDDAQTEWVELKNIGQQSIELRGLQITSGTKGKIHDPKQRFVLGDAKIAPGEYAVIGIGAEKCYASLKLPMFAAHCDEAKYAWLTNTGDSIAIRDAKGNIIDEVVYETESPWPATTRNGCSIQFIAPSEGGAPADANDDPKNWVISGASNSDEFKGHGRGTPGGPPKSDVSPATQPVLAKHKK